VAADGRGLADGLETVRRDVVAGAFEADVVHRLRVRHEEAARGRMHRHVEERRPDAAERAADLGGNRRARVDREDVLVGQVEADERAPVAAELVLPGAARPAIAILADDQAGLLARDAGVVLERRREAAGGRRQVAGGPDEAGALHGLVRAIRGRAVADAELVDRGRAIAGAEDGGVDAIARDAAREGTRSVAEERDHRKAIAGQRGPEIRRVEDVDVGAAEAGDVVVAVDDGRVLAAMGGADEGPPIARAREDDVVRLVADEQGADDARRIARDVDDADAVREVVHDPDLAVVPRRDGDGLEADGDAAGRRQSAGRVDAEDLEPGIGRVDDEELLAVR
jgi:hypothetical protein